MKLILIRSRPPQLLFYKMKSKREDKNMTTDTLKTKRYIENQTVHLV